VLLTRHQRGRYLRNIKINNDQDIPKDNHEPNPETSGSAVHIAPPAGLVPGAAYTGMSRRPGLPKYGDLHLISFYSKGDYYS